MSGTLELHFIEQGDGTPVLLLHGFPESSYSWRHQMPALAANGFRVIAADLPGYGGSPKPRDIDSYRIPEVVRNIAALCVRLGVRQVAGHDWGAVAAWYLAMLHPTLLDRLVILNAPHPVPFARELRKPAQKIRMAYQLFLRPPVIPELLMPWVLPAMMRRAGRFTEPEIAHYKEEWEDRETRRGMANYYRAIGKHRRELRPLVRRIDIPVLMIWGERDPVFLRQTTEDFYDWVPDLQLERIAHAGHFVQTDAPERVNDLLLGFLQR